jgi:SNF2 family DNA or RNA helicase
VLVVCPATLKVNWMRECNRWKPGLTVAIIDGMHEPTALQQAADVVVINYDIIHAHAGWLAKRGFKWIVADEAHYLKNLDVRWDKAKKIVAPSPKSPRRAIAFYYVQETIPHMLLLTGTPILNRVKELFPLLHLLDPKTWNSGYKFCVQYCAGHSEFVGRKEIFRCDGRSNMEELHGRLVERFMIRRTKDMLDLPAKQRRSMSVSLSEAGRKEYNKAANEFMKWLEGQQTEELAEGEPGPKERALRALALRKMTAMREIAARGKAEAASEWIASYFESTGRPLIVMGHHAAAFDAIVAAVDKLNEEAGRSDAELSRPIRYAKVLGETPMPTRQRAIDAFQAGELDVIFYSIKIAVGTTLTRAQDVLFIERDWVPGMNVQAEDRAHRLGQKNTVTITYLDAEGTIDQKIAMLLIDKTATAAGVIDGANLDEYDAAGVVLGELVLPPERKSKGGVKTNPAEVEPADSWEQAL